MIAEKGDNFDCLPFSVNVGEITRAASHDAAARGEGRRAQRAPQP